MDISEMYENIYPIRVDCLVDTYADIAEQAFGSFLDAAIDPAATVGLSPFEAHRRLRDRYERRRVSGIKTIVFSAMAIEAAAFEFAAMTLGDQVARNQDRMGIVKKWTTATCLASGQSLDVNGPAIKGLEKLVKARNDLVHHKSKPGDNEGKAMQAMRTEWATFEKDQVPNAFKTLVLLSLELESSPSGIFGNVPYRDKSICPEGFINHYSPHPRVKEVIDRCHEIHGKHLKGA